ncbi:type VI secretion system secreted protein VgrG [Skermanella aerolata]|uniref:type VI secretion system Vgr family protein n=1 Tax=Skermanella aerolata TaxID=393310 RepID=UPI003D25C16E
MTQREARIRCKVADLQLESLNGREALGRPFQFDVLVSSTDDKLTPSALLGAPLAVEMDVQGGRHRYFHGYVADATLLEFGGERTRYGLTVVPWLWFLTGRQDCRIFQNLDVVEILEKVFERYPTADFVSRVVERYRKREYCVQYRENDLDFITRLMEDEGIYYFFEHSAGGHELVLADHPSAHSAAPNYDTVPYYPPDYGARRERDYLDGWQAVARVRPAKSILRSFDFEKPRMDLTAMDEFTGKEPGATGEIYDYPGSYMEVSDGDTLARLRLEELRADHVRANGAGTAAGLASGGRFILRGFPRQDQNIDYLVLSVNHALSVEAFRSGGPESGEPYRCAVEVQDIRVPFRSPRQTPRPVVRGPQTAIVTGPPGEEIYTDKYGRVKVQFHWDREGKRNETSSCWIRVSQAWAGAGFGAMLVPRIGQEVIVDFLEGDPDRPLITGRVYNAAAMPPYKLPENATQSGWKSNSSKGGGGGNEIQMEDGKGGEKFNVVATKDYSIKVGQNETHDVTTNRTRTVGGKEEVTVKGARTRTVNGQEEVTVKGIRTRTITGAETYKTESSREYTVGAADTLRVTGDLTIEAGANRTLTITGADDVSAMSAALTVDTDRKVTANKSYSVEAPEVTITGLMSITLSVGPSSIKIDATGVTVVGPMVKLN